MRTLFEENTHVKTEWVCIEFLHTKEEKSLDGG